MKLNKQRMSSITVVLAISLLLTFAVFGAILYTLTKPGTWNVRVATGLELYYGDGVTPVTSISFTVDPLGSETQDFVLKNISNHAVNVTDNIPASTPLYEFTTTFVNNTIAQGGQYAFSITLTDIAMDSSVSHNGNFEYLVVDHFSVGTLSFETTTVNYASDSSQYFGFIEDHFNSSTYPVGSTVLYSFTTQNVNQSYEIQGLTYKLEILDSSNNVVDTVCDGLNIAYYQDATHYMHPDGSGSMGNGTHMTDVPLEPNQMMTIWQSFSTPSVPGVYHIRLTYQSHNAAPYGITWTTQIDNPYSQYVYVDTFTISGATASGTPGNVTVCFHSLDIGPVTISYNIVIQETGQTIDSQSSWTAPKNPNTNPHTVTFTPTQNGPLTMVLTITSSTHN
jgi:hypothetical protein